MNAKMEKRIRKAIEQAIIATNSADIVGGRVRENNRPMATPTEVDLLLDAMLATPTEVDLLLDAMPIRLLAIDEDGEASVNIGRAEMIWVLNALRAGAGWRREKEGS